MNISVISEQCDQFKTRKFTYISNRNKNMFLVTQDRTRNIFMKTRTISQLISRVTSYGSRFSHNNFVFNKT